MDQVVSAQENSQQPAISAGRLRIGVLLLFLWWIPFWLLEPVIDKVFDVTSATTRHEVLVVILVVQTILGVAGLLVTGKQVALIIRQSSYRKLPRNVWRMLRHGAVD